MADGIVGQKSQTAPDFYVYIWFRASGSPCYVGKGSGGRWRSHATHSHNPWLRRIFAKDGTRMHGELVAQHLSEAEAFELERLLISVIGRFATGGPLVNATDGGDGVSGYRQGPQQLAKLTATRIGRVLSADARAKISSKLSGRSFSLEHRAAISAAKKGRSSGPLSESHRAAIGEGHRGRKRSSDEVRSMVKAAGEMSVEARALKSQRISEALTGKKLSESHRATISRIQKGRTRSPEFRAKVSAGMRALRAKQRANRVQ